MLYFDNLHARIRMHMHMFSHAHADPTWTPRTHPFSMDSTNTVDPIDLWTSIKPERLLRSPCYCATSTLDLNSTHASPLRTRPACLSPSLRESLARVHPPLHEA